MCRARVRSCKSGCQRRCFSTSIAFADVAVPASHTVFLVSAVILWVIVIVFSVTGPVPINHRVKTWDIVRLPVDWEAPETPMGRPPSTR